VLRRLPALLVFGRLSQPLRPLRRQLFIGWFGPIGIGAIFYAAHAVERSAPKVVWSATTLIVAASVVAHGVSGTPLTVRYPPEET
jgi:NhaP-type Na+/H+ or K+/H+ antiporter